MRHKITSERARDLHKELQDAKNPHLADVIERNIEIIALLRRQAIKSRSREDVLADAVTCFSGSMKFAYLHVIWFGVWIAINMNLVPGVKAFDPYPFGLLTMIVSLEAIFLSTFVMVTQNRQAAVAERQDSLDLQIDLLAEYEVTRMLRLVDKIAESMGITDTHDTEIDQLVEPVAPELMIREIERQQKQR